MFPFFDPNRILLHSSSMQKYMVRVNKLDNNIPTHTRTYTHIAPGPGVEAHSAARPGRARRGVCGQLLRRAAETPEHVLLSTGSGPDHAQTCLGFGKYALRRPERAFEAQRHASGTSIFSPYVPRIMSLAAERRSPEAGARRSSSQTYASELERRAPASGGRCSARSQRHSARDIR